MNYFILINPFTNQPIEFTTYKDENFPVTNMSYSSNDTPIVEVKNAICIEIPEVDQTLLSKTYDPTTGLLG